MTTAKKLKEDDLASYNPVNIHKYKYMEELEKDFIDFYGRENVKKFSEIL